MRGQLWQECTRCGAEPVCIDCERCDKHCRCAQRQREEKEIREFEAMSPGLLQKIAEHHEQGSREH